MKAGTWLGRVRNSCQRELGEEPAKRPSLDQNPEGGHFGYKWEQLEYSWICSGASFPVWVLSPWLSAWLETIFFSPSDLLYTALHNHVLLSAHALRLAAVGPGSELRLDLPIRFPLCSALCYMLGETPHSQQTTRSLPALDTSNCLSAKLMCCVPQGGDLGLASGNVWGTFGVYVVNNL